MRRILSLLLLVLVSSPLIVPLFASGEASSLPSCCRRDGAHHCAGMGMAAAETTSAPQFTRAHGKCPVYPSVARTSQLHTLALAPRQTGFGHLVAHPSGRPQTEARYRVSFSRARQKRGPPTILA